jgi:hypothetical protein
METEVVETVIGYITKRRVPIILNEKRMSFARLATFIPH